MKTALRIVNAIVFLPFLTIGILFLLWNNIDDKIRHHKKKQRSSEKESEEHE